MYGAELSSHTQQAVRESIIGLNLKHESAEKLARKLAKKLSNESARLFGELLDYPQDEDAGEEPERLTAEINYHAAQHIRNIRDIADTLIELLNSEPAAGNSGGSKTQIIWELTQIRDQAALLVRHKDLICWLETPRQNTATGAEPETLLCAIPKDLDEKLYADLCGK